KNSVKHRLAKAMKSGHLVPYIQPIVDTRNNQIIGGEVLIRWNDPDKGNIPTDEFINIAEKSKLARKITAICFESVLESLTKISDNNQNEIILCFNTSAADFLTYEIVDLCRKFIDNAIG
ncbi:TPA: EAL domain-containing protein, partial [Enterobacter bugandensis]|nr:EAL domain-containing protein [Enterobacter bugandensis]